MEHAQSRDKPLLDPSLLLLLLLSSAQSCWIVLQHRVANSIA
ncbi:predicted protein [Plenodomus lingam JN3]|uniref:Predicted protein n=1 Tax=Leptosphaeria maculans (strain JN3 / isolate v23.1.3 / race Av1-4-5-6-7-8) TaxID=985895 RepID=E4ZNW0_LEPMJ|nr:predicted protein [Plenodomus lingam JN3]CBX93329.1 predicted protein [Plenodomus lingam JN3]